MTPKFTKVNGNNTFTTLLVTAQSPYLLDPDIKYNPAGDLKCYFTVEDNDYWRCVIEQCKEDLKEFATKVHKDSGKKPCLSVDLPWIENDDRTITFKTKRIASLKKKDNKIIRITVPQFDVKCQPIMPMVDICEGSSICLNVEIYRWAVINNVGVSLRPVAVQVIELHKQRCLGRSADEYGFGMREAGSPF
ncbi:hypothetical protein ACSZNT_11290 [Aeromonas veronii]